MDEAIYKRVEGLLLEQETSVQERQDKFQDEVMKMIKATLSEQRVVANVEKEVKGGPEKRKELLELKNAMVMKDILGDKVQRLKKSVNHYSFGDRFPDVPKLKDYTSFKDWQQHFLLYTTNSDVNALIDGTISKKVIDEHLATEDLKMTCTIFSTVDCTVGMSYVKYLADEYVSKEGRAKDLYAALVAEYGAQCFGLVYNVAMEFQNLCRGADEPCDSFIARAGRLRQRLVDVGYFMGDTAMIIKVVSQLGPEYDFYVHSLFARKIHNMSLASLGSAVVDIEAMRRSRLALGGFEGSKPRRDSLSSDERCLSALSLSDSTVVP